MLIRELAVYEREPDAVEATPADLEHALFGPDPRAHCHVAQLGPDGGGPVVGFALWFVSFSTWRGRHGIWLEDVFVLPSHRGLGVGRALLAELAAQCRRHGYARLEWSVLDWNEPARAFYRRIGAVPQDEWDDVPTGRRRPCLARRPAGRRRDRPGRRPLTSRQATTRRPHRG